MTIGREKRSRLGDGDFRDRGKTKFGSGTRLTREEISLERRNDGENGSTAE